MDRNGVGRTGIRLVGIQSVVALGFHQQTAALVTRCKDPVKICRDQSRAVATQTDTVPVKAGGCTIQGATDCDILQIHHGIPVPGCIDIDPGIRVAADRVGISSRDAANNQIQSVVVDESRRYRRSVVHAVQS